MKPRKHPAKDARNAAKMYAAEVAQTKRALGHLLHPDTSASTMLTDEYQARLADLSRALCGEPVRPMWLSGGERDGWWLSGQKDGDFALPDTKGCRTWLDALTAAERWVSTPKARDIERGEHRDRRKEKE